jgi:hypothetical protein
MVRLNSQLWWRRKRRMRGEERRQRAMLVVIDPERWVPKHHPLRRIKQLAEVALDQLSPVFNEM